MSNTKKIRATLGLSQQQLADYLNVTCTQIGMWETGRRELPTPAVLKLGKLVSGLHNAPFGRRPEPLSEKERAFMRRHAESCQYKAKVAQKKLDELQQKYQGCIKALAVINHLQNNRLQGKEAAKDQAWLELLQIQTKKKLRRCGPAAQFKLKLNLQALHVQAEEAGKMKW